MLYVVVATTIFGAAAEGGLRVRGLQAAAEAGASFHVCDSSQSACCDTTLGVSCSSGSRSFKIVSLGGTNWYCPSGLVLSFVYSGGLFGIGSGSEGVCLVTTPTASSDAASLQLIQHVSTSTSLTGTAMVSVAVNANQTYTVSLFVSDDKVAATDVPAAASVGSCTMSKADTTCDIALPSGVQTVDPFASVTNCGEYGGLRLTHGGSTLETCLQYLPHANRMAGYVYTATGGEWVDDFVVTMSNAVTGAVCPWSTCQVPPAFADDTCSTSSAEGLTCCPCPTALCTDHGVHRSQCSCGGDCASCTTKFDGSPQCQDPVCPVATCQLPHGVSVTGNKDCQFHHGVECCACGNSICSTADNVCSCGANCRQCDAGSGRCQACDSGFVLSSADGACGPRNGVGMLCTSDGDCATAVCVAGRCSGAPAGAYCGDNADCASGVCVGSTCCVAGTSSECSACSGSGQCTGCSIGYTHPPACTPTQSTGPCSDDRDCTSTLCLAGACCALSLPQNAQCTACNVTNGECTGCVSRYRRAGGSCVEELSAGSACVTIA